MSLKCDQLEVSGSVVFSLVDKRAGFSNPEFVGSNHGSVNFFYYYFFKIH